MPLKLITPGMDELSVDEVGVDGIADDIADELDDEMPTELPTEEAGLLLVGANLDDPPPPPPQANSNVQTHTSSVRTFQRSIGRAIVVLISSPI